LVAERLSARLRVLASNHGASFTQYVDDIAISGPSHVGRLSSLVRRIAQQEGFILNPSKTVIAHRDREQIVTGVRVDQGADIPRAKLREIRSTVQDLAKSKLEGVPPLPSKISRVQGQILYVRHLNPGAATLIGVRLSPGI
jgi:hypothetical protein